MAAVSGVSCAVVVLVLHTVASLPLLQTPGLELGLEEVFISVKSTASNHGPRLGPLLDTWHQEARESTWVFTDAEDAGVAARMAPGHLVRTRCPADHSRQSLCCKMEAEIETFLRDTDRKWFCHVDDDNYVNVAALLRTLRRFPAHEDWYLGKVSISTPLLIHDKARDREVSFVFGTGGAGFCLSRSVAARMGAMSESVSAAGARIGLPDDVTVGYLATVELGVPLTQLPSLHSHLEALRRVGAEAGQLADQVTLSYGRYEDGTENHVLVPGLELARDPTTMYSLHCAIYGKCIEPPETETAEKRREP